MHTTTLLGLVVAAIILRGAITPGRAATGLPPGFQDATFVSGLSNPTAMQFVAARRPPVRRGAGRTAESRQERRASLDPFMTLSVNSSGERGLLGVAFDPNFASNQFIYVFYTATTPAVHNRISRFKANGDVVDTSVAEVVLLDFDNLSGATNHNGGAMHFGLDGKLYAAHGDNANGNNSQTLGNLLGKVIRMNPVPDSTAQIPADNPFFATATGKNRLIWTLGLRNPFTFNIQPGTGLTDVNDVGEVTWEEINDARGTQFRMADDRRAIQCASFRQFTNPSFAYRHSSGIPTGCAITGGTFYNPPTPRPLLCRNGVVVLRQCKRPGRRHASSFGTRLAHRLPPRHTYTSGHAEHDGHRQRHVPDPGQRRNIGQRLVSRLSHGHRFRAYRRRHSSTCCPTPSHSH